MLFVGVCASRVENHCYYIMTSMRFVVLDVTNGWSENAKTQAVCFAKQGQIAHPSHYLKALAKLKATFSFESMKVGIKGLIAAS